MPRLPSLWLLLAAAPALHAQTLQTTITALTPITVQATANGQTVGNRLPVGPLPPGSVTASLATPGLVFAQVDWTVSDTSYHAAASITHSLHASSGVAVALVAGPHES